MLDEKYIDFMNQEIDGANSSEESSELKKHLASNPEARQYFDDLLTLSTLMSTVKEVEPSSALKKNIMTDIASKKLYEQERGTFLGSLFERFQMQGALKYAYVFSCGLIVGLLVYTLFVSTPHKGNSLDISRLYGTMTLKDVAGTLKSGDRFTIDMEHMSGSIEVAYSESIVFVEMKVETQKEIELTLDFGEQDLSVYGYAQANGTRGTVTMSERLVEITHTGDNIYQVILNNTTRNPPTLSLKITAEGVVLYDRPIIVKGDNE
jgi:hypothetical protein